MNHQIDFDTIKLIIWDLDDTFWKGTISEGAICLVDQNILLLKAATDCGVLNSICSKNHFNVCKDELEKAGLLEYFIFPSIDWTPKGVRVKRIIEQCQLRAGNVLYLDDNPQNLEEALHYNPSLLVAAPVILDEYIAHFSGRDRVDPSHQRLKQYKLLEAKNIERSAYASNEEFLFASQISCEFGNDCIEHLERIHDLVNRSNQLNYTKVRSSEEELRRLFQSKVQCGYVTVKDRFGDYGIVGFFALNGDTLEHFVFSCRTIGVGIEQYVYSTLNYPKLSITGEVVSIVDRSETPKWINQPRRPDPRVAKHNQSKSRVMMKGPCDLSQMQEYLNGLDIIDCEFTYTSKKNQLSIAHHNHSLNILNTFTLSLKEKGNILSECVFFDDESLQTGLQHHHYDVLLLSTLIEPHAGIYRNNESGVKIAFGESKYPLTDQRMWHRYQSIKSGHGELVFTEKYLSDFSQRYTFCGEQNESQYQSNLIQLLELIPNTTICLLLGSEMPYLENTKEEYVGREQVHKRMNDALRSFADQSDRVRLIDVNDYIASQNDFTNSMNHFQRRIYYDLACKFVEIVGSVTPVRISAKNKLFVELKETIQGFRADLSSARPIRIIGSRVAKMWRALKVGGK